MAEGPQLPVITARQHPRGDCLAAAPDSAPSQSGWDPRPSPEGKMKARLHFRGRGSACGDS